MISRRALTGLVSVAAGVAALATPGTATAAPASGWGADRRVGTADTPFPNADVRVAPNGAALAYWLYTPPGGLYRPAVATRTPGGTWSAPHRLPMRGGNATAQVGIDDAGRSVALWSDGGGTSRRLLWAQHPAAGAWSVARVVPVRPTDAVGGFAVAGTGGAVLAFVRQGAVYAVRLTPAGRWTAPVRVSAQGTGGAHPTGAVVSLRDNGWATIAWDWHVTAGQGGPVYLQRGGLTAAGRADARANLAGPERGLVPGIATSASGDGTVISIVHDTNAAGRSYSSVVWKSPDGRWHRRDNSSHGNETTSVVSAMWRTTVTTVWVGTPNRPQPAIWLAQTRSGRFGADRLLDTPPTGKRYLIGNPTVALGNGVRAVAWDRSPVGSSGPPPAGTPNDVVLLTRTATGETRQSIAGVRVPRLGLAGPRAALLTLRESDGGVLVRVR